MLLRALREDAKPISFEAEDPYLAALRAFVARIKAAPEVLLEDDALTDAIENVALIERLTLAKEREER